SISNERLALCLPSFDTENEPKIARSVEKFFKDYKVMELLRRCGLRKSKGIPLWSILSSKMLIM
ncbi:hypothetical protein, partial [Lactobacillus delbrueckii]